MSFRLKTVLGIAAIEILLLAVLVLSGLYYIQTSNEERIFREAHTAADLLATMTTDATVALDLATLDELVQQAARNPGIVYARIRSAEGQVLSENGVPAALTRDFKEDRSTESALEDTVLDVAAKIKIGDHVFGQVEIGLSTEELSATLKQARDWMLSIAATEIVLVAIFGLILGQILTRQLVRLQTAAHRVASGDFGFQTVVYGKDELAQTASSFNEMSNALSSYKQKFEEALERAEDKRAKAESRLYAAIEALPLGIALVDSEDRILHVNQGYRQLHQLSDETTAEGQNFAAVIAEQSGHILELSHAATSIPDSDTALSVADMLEARLQIHRSQAPYETSEVKLANGRIILSTQQRTPDSSLILVDTDVSELHESAERTRRLEANLLQKQKLESLGTLAGGVAHEINTPAQFVNDNLRFLQEAIADLFTYAKTLADDLSGTDKSDNLAAYHQQYDIDFLEEELPTSIRQALEGTTRIRDIVSAVQTYARPEDTMQTDVNINATIRNAIAITESEWKCVASLDEDLDETLPQTVANSGQLGQVIVNLIVNATDAISEIWKPSESDVQGRIGVRSRADKNSGIWIEVSDNGPGIPPEIRDRIFDPFFTTKEVGKGTGQGLSLCQSIICDTHKGKLIVEDKADGGTKIRIWLPVSETG
ncbi:ATP-binding protein [Nisaea sp.]|uniref:ATP-binding protein n=1 Tax=Nisaea sp. TaxID=2024842 RepID=UPI0032982DF2